jgi:DNA polymerase-3 subunit delta
MFYILHGDEEFSRSEEIAKLRDQIAEDGMGDLNISVLDGRGLSLSELLNACSTLPFLTERRLVIVENLLQRFQPRGRGSDSSGSSDKEYAEKLRAYLPDLPATTRLVFVDNIKLRRSNPIIRWASESKEGYIREFSAPKSNTLQGWIVRRAQEKGVRIHRDAVAKLVSSVGDDLRLLDRELEKLAGYSDYATEIDSAAVDELVSAAQEANIFGLVDALGMRQMRQALGHLERLFADGAHPLYILTMVARQIRLIMSVKDLVEKQGLGRAAIGNKLRISHGFLVDKLMRQAQRFQLEELRTLMRSILQIDQAIKTGRVHEELALELLVVRTCRAARG